MTSNETITYLRTKLKLLDQTNVYSDPFIWREFVNARAKVLRNLLTNFNFISELNYHKVCIELQDALEHECKCVTEGCTIKRSKHKLPSIIVGRNSSTLRVSKLNGENIPVIKYELIEDELKYNEVYKNKEVAIINNGYLFIYNSSLTLVNVHALWVNPLDLLFIQKCESDNCLSDNKDLIEISEEKLSDIVSIMANQLSITLQVKDDNVGDNNSDIR